MVDLAEIQAAYYMVAATGVLVAAVFYILNLRISQKNQEISQKNQELMLKAQQQTLEARQMGLIENITSQLFNEDGMKRYYELMNFNWKDYDDFERKYGSDFNVEATAKRFAAWTSFNSLGIMLRKGMVEAEDLYDLGVHGGISFWWKYQPIIEENRRRYNGSQYLKDYEFMVGELERVAMVRDPSFVKPKTGTKYIPDVR
jgi:hypothetical protein